MCLDSSKQNFTVLSALAANKPSGFSYFDLAKAAKKFALDTFGSERFGYRPEPFQSKMAALVSDGEVFRLDNGRFQITTKGEGALQFLKNREIPKR